MQHFNVDDELAALVERLAKKRPFENLSFNDALRRVLKSHLALMSPEHKRDELEELVTAAPLAPSRIELRKAPSPSPTEWIATVPELRSRKGLNTWKAVCDLLKIDTAGDSARRRLKNWVKANRPMWPSVPDIVQK